MSKAGDTLQDDQLFLDLNTGDDTLRNLETEGSHLSPKTLVETCKV